MARDGLMRKHAALIQQYEKVLHFIPDVDDLSSKRTWERQMRHARELLRSVAVCDEEGQRQDLYNHTRDLCRFLFVNQMEYRLMLPDLAEDCTDSDWIITTLDFFQVAMGMAASPWYIQ